MASFYQQYKTPILIVIIIVALGGNFVVASRTWLKGFSIGNNPINLLGNNLGSLVGISGGDFSILPNIPKSLETTVLQDAIFLTLNSLPVLDTIKPKSIIIEDDTLSSFGKVRITNSGVGNTLLVTWEEPAAEELSAIKIYRSNVFGSLGSLITQATPEQRSFRDDNVVTGETYFYTLRGVDVNRNEADQIFQYPGKVIDVLPPPSPFNITVLPSASSVRVSWEEPVSNDYNFSRVYRSTLPGQLGKLIADSVRSGEFTDTTIISGVTYYYTVTSVDTSLNESPRETSPSLMKRFIEKTGVLAKGDILLLITNIEVKNAGTGNAITLSWSNPSDISFSSVRLYRSTSFNEPGVLLADLPSEKNTYTDLSVTRDTVYYYTLRTVDVDGRESDNIIQYVSAARDTIGPQIPLDIKVEQTIPTLVNISWERPTDADLAYYRVYRSTDKETSGHLVANEITEEVWTDTDISDNRVYYYVVTSVDASNNESAKPISFSVIGGRIPFTPFIIEGN